MKRSSIGTDRQAARYAGRHSGNSALGDVDADIVEYTLDVNCRAVGHRRLCQTAPWSQ